MGRYRENSNRPLKVVMENEDQVYCVIKSSTTLRASGTWANISFSFDRTPRQIEHYRRVKSTLQERISNGETNLKIKYVNGCPKIITLN